MGFAGTPTFAGRALEAILNAGFPLQLVLTQPDRPKGRGLSLIASPVKQIAIAHRIPLFQPATLKSAETRGDVLACPLDVLVVAAYGLILPAAVLAWPRYGCLNIHASALPRWRGAAPIQRAIAAGDTTTGVTIMQMDAGLDTGPVVAEVEVIIASRETARTLEDKLATIGAAAMVDVLRRLARDGALDTVPQPTSGATYAAKIDRAAAAIDWTQSATNIDRGVRAFDPVPGAHSELHGEPFKVWGAQCVAAACVVAPGTVIASTQDGIDVGCGEQVLRLTSVQPAGGRRMPAAAFAVGRAIVAGMRFGASPAVRD